jgi:predicted RND superfamily exporter protein
MTHWTPGMFLGALVAVIFIPALVLYFTVGRKGGHHLYDKDNLSPEEIRELPFRVSRKLFFLDIKGTLAALIALAIAGGLYSAAHKAGVHLTPKAIFPIAAGVVGVAILFNILTGRWGRK